MSTRRCVVCGDEYVLTERETRSLHPDTDFLCGLSCIRKRLQRKATWVKPKCKQWCTPHVSSNGNNGEVWSRYFKRGFMSRYEIAVAYYFKCHDIEFRYEPYEISLGTTFWLPDFYIPKSRTFVEVKGQWLGSGKEKITQVLRQYPSLRLVVIPNLLYRQFVKFCMSKRMIDFAQKNFTTRRF